jgi:dethiobiotin synthetase
VTARALFVTGTDTDVGKTLVACALVRGFAAQGLRTAVMKPIASGAVRTSEGLRNRDALELLGASNVPAPYPLVNPYCFEPPISPHIAADEAKITIDIDLIARNLASLRELADWVVIEGVGGWLAPLTARQSVADLACSLGAPVVMVVGLKLGCLNHAQLTRASIRAHGAPFAGWVANHLDPHMARVEQNLASLVELLGEPPLARVPHVPSGASALTLKEAAAALALRT